MANEDEGSKPGRKHPEGERKFNQQQYDLLKSCSDKRDITEWNKWRKEHRYEEIRLQGAFLEGAHLENADLVDAHLENATLSFAHLENANFYSAHLENDILIGAHLEKANLRDAHLENADLKHAHLENALLGSAHLENADLAVAHLENAELDLAYLENANLSGAHLENAKLVEAHLENAILYNAHLENAKLGGAHLENADFSSAYLENAIFWNANLGGASFWDAKLQGADFSRAIVDGKTLFSENCEVDLDTKFETVALGNMRIYPKIKQLLEYNIRRQNWEVWYKEHCILQWPVKLFWSFSDYGMSTGRIIFTFLALSVIFATVYFVWGAVDYYLLGIEDEPGVVRDLFVKVLAKEQISEFYYSAMIYFRSIYFSIVTMTTLGFGDMYANATRLGYRFWAGHLLLMLQVILGYILLGALVTRFAVLFTAGGPAGKFAPTKTKETREEKKHKE